MRTIVEAMTESAIYKGMLPEVDKLLKLFLTFPVTTATVERSFSSLRHVKTYLRSTMTSCRLNNLFLLYIYTHQDRTDTLDLQKKRTGRHKNTRNAAQPVRNRDIAVTRFWD